MQLPLVHLLFSATLVLATAPQYCSQYAAVVSSMSKDQCATNFCSSYLHITTSVATAYVTSIDVTTMSVVSGAACPTPLPGTPTVYVTMTAATYTSTCGAHNAKRAASSSASSCTTPSVLKSVPSTVISSACSCLDIPTPKSTVTSIVKSTSTAITTVAPTPQADPTAVTSTITITPTKYALPPGSTSVASDQQSYDVYNNFDVHFEDLSPLAVATFPGKSGNINLQDCLDYCETFNVRFPGNRPCIAVAFKQVNLAEPGQQFDPGYVCYAKYSIGSCGNADSTVTFAVKHGADYPAA